MEEQKTYEVARKDEFQISVLPFLSRQKGSADLTGHIFGKLTVIGFAGRDKKSNALWLCQCECGTKKIIESFNLRKHTYPARSCGCTRGLPQGIGAMNKLFYGYKKDAKKRGLPFEITIDKFALITTQRCHYCGISPQQITGGPKNNGYYPYNGIDRIDNGKGYFTDNVVTCCKVCNRMKTDMSQNHFLLHVGKVAVYQRIMEGGNENDRKAACGA